MTNVQRRMKKVIERHGDSFTVGGSGRKGIFSVLDSDRASAYLTATQLSTLGRPIWQAFVVHDDPTVAANVVTWDGSTLTVQKVVKARLQDATIAKIIVLA